MGEVSLVPVRVRSDGGGSWDHVRGKCNAPGGIWRDNLIMTVPSNPVRKFLRAALILTLVLATIGAR